MQTTALLTTYNNERSQEVICRFSSICSLHCSLTFHVQLTRKSSQDSSSKNKETKPLAVPAAVPPPPPPNTTKPLPQPVPAAQGLPGASVNNTSNHSLHSQTQSLSNRSSPSPGSSTPDWRYSPGSSSPVPPIVVVSSDPAPEPAARSVQYAERPSIGLDGNPVPQRPNTFNRHRPGPRDTIPIVGKPPRKQRSSRFVVTEKAEIEKLASFNGLCPPLTVGHTF